MQQGEISGLVPLDHMVDFNFPDINWEYHTAVTSRSGKFPKYVEDNFLPQVLCKPTRKGALLALLFVNREGFVGDVVVCGCLGHSDHEMVEFTIFGINIKRSTELLHRI